jgi:UDP-N-acetylglucosamine/UDP-N-acetylgalactosamine 4-epimerase
MNTFSALKAKLQKKPQQWLITGVAGFIGSHLLETLLSWDQDVTGLDNLSTGSKANLEDVRQRLSVQQWSRFHWIEGDIRKLDTCMHACAGKDYILHQAALGSVPRSLDNPLASHDSNINGFLHILLAARDQKVKRVVFASSSSTYGDHPDLPKKEAFIGQPLSPYALTKQVNELYSKVFHRCYGVESIGLRYFNVFGPRQNLQGPYAAVIPRWITACLKNTRAEIHGDGENSRDFCYIKNAVQANLLAATTDHPEAIGKIYNIALGKKTSLNHLFSSIKEELEKKHPHLKGYQPDYVSQRAGDVPHSLADITQAQRYLDYQPTHQIHDGLKETISWYQEHLLL